MICGVCRRPILSGQLWDADHIIPVTLGGSWGIENMQPAHRHCNISKGGRNRVRSA
ncbi:MAG: HNH endonuclease [Nitrospiraceae bacterium]